MTADDEPLLALLERDHAADADGPGRLLGEQSRLVIPTAGRGRAKIYGAPTANGWVCLVSFPHIAATHCSRSLLKEGITVGASRSGDQLTIYGLVADDVTKIALDLGDKREAVLIGSNAFYCDFSFGEGYAVPRALIVTHHDESTARVSLDFLAG